MIYQENDQIWQIVRFSSAYDDLNEKCLIAKNLIIQRPDIEEKFHDYLCKFIENNHANLLNDIRIYAAVHSKWLKTSQALQIIAELACREMITQNYAAEIISNFSNERRSDLNKNELRVVEMADIVYEDFVEGFYDVKDDEIFINSLTKFLANLASNLA